MSNVTLGQLMQSVGGLNKLAVAKLPLKASLHIGRLLRKAAPEIEDYKARFNHIIKSYGVPITHTEDGEGFKKGDPVLLEDGQPMIGILTTDPRYPEAQKALDELESAVADIGEYRPLNPDMLGTECVLTPQEMMPLTWVFAEENGNG